jgi:hypothetical protein
LRRGHHTGEHSASTGIIPDIAGSIYIITVTTPDIIEIETIETGIDADTDAVNRECFGQEKKVVL